jgi:hypothetical protein
MRKIAVQFGVATGTVVVSRIFRTFSRPDRSSRTEAPMCEPRGDSANVRPTNGPSAGTI